MPKLQAAVLAASHVALDRVPAIQNRGSISTEEYNEHLNVLVAACYVFAPQGRIGGFQKLKLNQYNDLIQQGYALTSEFKTNAIYGFQCVLMKNSIQRNLFRAYVKVLLPVFAFKRCI